MKILELDTPDGKELDHLLVKLCEKLVTAKLADPDYYGWVAAGVLDPDDHFVSAVNIPSEDGDRIHAEAAAMQKYQDSYGDIPEGSIIVTTLSPCNEYMKDREGPSCTDLINSSPVRKVYCGFMDPSQEQDANEFSVKCTKNKKINEICKKFAEQFLGPLKENFADSRGPGRPGDSQRHGIPKKATMAELEKASHSKGRKGQLARWQLNMRRGHKK